MPVVATFSGDFLLLVRDALGAAGFDWQEGCRRAGLDPDSLAKPDSSLPLAGLFLLWQEAARQLGETSLGPRVGELIRPRSSNVVFYLLMSSRTLREGLKRLARYRRVLATGVDFELLDGREPAFIRLGLPPAGSPLLASIVEFVGVGVLRYCEWVTDHDFRPTEVWFQHAPPADKSEHERVFGCPIRFSAEDDGLLVSAEQLDRPSVFSNPELAREHERVAAKLVARIDDPSTAGRVRHILLAQLESDPPGIAPVARELGMSVRTLQRRLAGEKTNYATLVDDLRHEVALDRLVTSDAPIHEIAYLTGYSDPRAFYRAFKRWTNRAPTDFRSVGR